MSPRTKKQIQHIKETTRGKILLAALETISKEGYAGSSISKIAKKAGISKGNIYNHFLNKEELIKVVLLEGMKSIVNEYTNLKDGIKTKEEFTKMVDQNFEVLSKNHSYWKLYYSVLLQPQLFQLIQEEMMEMTSPIIKTFTEYFKTINYKDPEAVTWAFISSLDGITLSYVMNPEWYPLDKVKQSIINIYTKHNRP